MRVFALESSCDELAVAILERDGKTLLCNLVHSQSELHARFGGVVPEEAARDHIIQLSPMLRKALLKSGLTWNDLDAFAVTRGPGLVGPLLIGIECIKGLALALQKPLVGVHHLEGHIAAAFLEHDIKRDQAFGVLIVSGGHTRVILAEGEGGPYTGLASTRDDAAGEAFDKAAKLLGLGYPGGHKIDELAQKGNPDRFEFPKLMVGKNNLDFSFSGLKTHVLRAVQNRTSSGRPFEGQDLFDFCAGFQKTVVDHLVSKTLSALQGREIQHIILAGGVAANSELRNTLTKKAALQGIQVLLPSKPFCTDNAAMIARAAWSRLISATPEQIEKYYLLDFAPKPNWPLEALR